MEKQYGNGLVLGKFMPFHLGHKYLIDKALEQCNHLTVLVCSLTSEPINGDLRYTWVKDSYADNNNVTVLHVTKNVPLRLSDLSTDFSADGDEFFWSVWIDIIKDCCPNVDVLFTSEEYGTELVEKYNETTYFKINHELVDLGREAYPISGSILRHNLKDYWGFLPKAVRPHFAKKIAIVGPESVGKSTMTKLLAEHYDTSYVAEYGREYTNTLDMRLDTHEFTLGDISNIAAGHLYREELLLQDSNYLFFADTETITTEIWSEIYFNKSPQWLKDINKIHPYKYDMYFLLDVDVPWVGDGTRHMSDPKQRRWHFLRLRDELVKRNLPFAIVSGSDYTERFNKIVKGIDHFIIYKQEH